MILPDCDAPSVRLSAERIETNLKEHWASQSPPLVGPSVTVSVGYTLFPVEASDLGSLVRLADGRLFQAKQAGRNQVVGAVATEAAEVSKRA